MDMHDYKTLMPLQGSTANRVKIETPSQPAAAFALRPWGSQNTDRLVTRQGWRYAGTWTASLCCFT